MLETRDLCKVYKPKKGVPVTALNKISLKFPQTGMVFLLGKSGSGKSTLLNLLGGLDRYDGGEIIIKGVSSKDFKQQYFDSYRNTYVGFIFQEYNVLDEFTVGANIALAVELQGRKATDEEINSILKEVDLEGYGNRKPNELSGGQKQRVAIARALVKNPEIIMADEPTGALDSNTGRQVFDTLKKLSKNKLVIIVSHDREFSEQYADRIIELADGSVISDVEIDSNTCEVKSEEIARDEEIRYYKNTIKINAGYHITEADRIAINNYIDTINNVDCEIQLDNTKTNNKKFTDTDQSKIKSEDGSAFKLIKSKLPMKSAFKIGASGLKYKKFRLFMTVVLSCIAFGLFGLSDTLGSYDHPKTCAESIIDSDIQFASFVKSIKINNPSYEWWNSYGTSLSKDDLEKIINETGIDVTGVYTPLNMSIQLSDSNFDAETKFTETDYEIYGRTFSGYAEINQKILDNMNCKLIAGVLPNGSKNEIVISKYMAETFVKGKYSDGSLDSKGNLIYQTITNASEIVGKTLILNGKTYTISGIVDTNFDFDRYESLMTKKDGESSSDQLINYTLFQEFYTTSFGSLDRVIMVGDGFVENMMANVPKIYSVSSNADLFFYNNTTSFSAGYVAKLSDLKDVDILWLDEEKTTLSDKEIILSADIISENFGEAESKEEYIELLKDEIFDGNYYSDSSEEAIYGITIEGYKVVGIALNNKDEKTAWGNTVIIQDKIVDVLAGAPTDEYAFAVGKMPSNESEVLKLTRYCYESDGNIRYELQNAVTYELDTINEGLNVLAKVFLYVGIGFAIFASIMLANFIATSIAHKKQEIGILRAIGSRSNDVFRIFFSESFIIAMINFVLSATGVGIATAFINYVIRKELGVLITVLSFGPRQILLLFVISIVVAAIASFLPVKKIASKKPIDAIRNR